MALTTVLFAVMLLPVACGRSSPPRIVPHDPPDLHIDLNAIEEAGCFLSTSTSDVDYKCPEDSIYGQLGCNRIEISHILGGLTPAYPIVKCNRDPFGMVHGPIPFDDVVNINGELVILNTRRARELYAPIDSPDEALSYALLTTDRYAWYPDDLWEGFTEFYTHEIEATHVVETVNGYRVFLFDDTAGSCEKVDVVESAPVEVTRDGTVTELEKTKLLGYVGVCF
jgi:hypothetical protein